MTTVRVFAPAKINLTLHVTGQRPDGYHSLDSLVTFADVGDWVSVARSEVDRLHISGPFAKDVPASDDNLVLQAARFFGSGFEIKLEKNLPVASGIGGGSADAAATLKAVSQLVEQPLPGLEAQLKLGADVPVCMMGGTVRMRGIGEVLEPVAADRLGWPMVLVNPGAGVSTPAVFQRLALKENPPMETLPPGLERQDAAFDWLAAQRNDLESPAQEILPVVGEVLEEIRRLEGCLLGRMSGSGATCFGLFRDHIVAENAARALRTNYPDWWVVGPTHLDP